jgi:hypothetical protein
MRIRATGRPLYQLKVTLQGARPAIWRRIVLPCNVPLKRLHDALQAVMGWTDDHLHQFQAGEVLYGTSDREFGIQRVSENKTTLDQVLRRVKDRLLYEYDFGDSWMHDVVLEKVLPPTREGTYPLVLAGKRACPPEDVGGMHGYHHLLQVLADAKHPEYAEMREWVGEEFDPEAFDVRQANLQIHGGWVLNKNNA